MQKDLTKEQRSRIEVGLTEKLNELYDQVFTKDNLDENGTIIPVVAFSMEDILKRLASTYGLSAYGDDL